jgi:hypothetical protein
MPDWNAIGAVAGVISVFLFIVVEWSRIRKSPVLRVVLIIVTGFVVALIASAVLGPLTRQAWAVIGLLTLLIIDLTNPSSIIQDGQKTTMSWGYLFSLAVWGTVGLAMALIIFQIIITLIIALIMAISSTAINLP